MARRSGMILREDQQVDVVVRAQRATDEMLDRIAARDPPGKGRGGKDRRDLFRG
ncbi:MAG: hypothetical protein J0H44_15925 [Alphaproteobacteria bacterium]|nr:hypothetical protein [Alphaproteobacteria bacterium]